MKAVTGGVFGALLVLADSTVTQMGDHSMGVTVTPESVLRPAPTSPAAVGAVPDGVAPATGASDTSFRVTVSVASLAAVVIGCVVMTLVFADDDFGSARSAAPMEGLTIFAVFFVAATAVERLLEPIAGWLLPKQSKETEAEAAKSEAGKAVAAAVAAPAQGGLVAAANGMLVVAAEKEAILEDHVWARTVVYWALASVIGMYAAAGLHLYFLRTVGIASGSRWEEILATGLIIGAGTKPLHDLTKLISATKEKAEATA